MASHGDDSSTNSSGGYSDDETSQGPTSYVASQATGLASDQMLSHLGITPKIAPAYDGTTSWLEHEQLVDDWCDIATLDETKRGSSLKTRLSGFSAVQKEALDRDRLCSANRVEHFKKKMRPFFVKGDLVTWIAKFDILLQRLRWMDLLPEVTSADNPPQFATARIRPSHAYKTQRNTQHMQNNSSGNGIANMKTPQSPVSFIPRAVRSE